MGKFSDILDIALKFLCGAWIVYSFVTTRKALKSLEELEEYDD